MKNILITYSSKTGNTEKVAKAIYRSISIGEFLPISQVTHLNYDYIIVGGWIDKGTFDKTTLNFIQNIRNKNVGYFFTLGAYPDSKHAQDCTKNIEEILVKNQNIVVGKYFCQGAIDPKLISWLSTLPCEHKMSPSEERKKRWQDASTHPDALDLEKASEIFKFLLKK